MNLITSSLLQKIILGYRIVATGERPVPQPTWHKIRTARKGVLESKPLDIEETATTFGLPASTIENIYNETKEIEANLPKEPVEEFDFEGLKNKIENLEKKAVNSGLYIVPQIVKSINQSKERFRELELAAAQELDPVSEARKQIEEAEREKKILEEAKARIMEKYYNREIDEASLKNITDNYEQRLVEANIKIKNWEEELEKLKKEPLSGKSQKEKKERFLASLEAVKVGLLPFTAQIPKIVVNLPHVFPAAGTKQIEAGQPSLQISRAAQTGVQAVPRPDSSEAIKLEQVKKPKGKLTGIDIPRTPKHAIKIGSLEAEQQAPYISLSYPLIPRLPAKGDPIFAYAKIFWDENTNRYVYNLIEPKMTEKLKEVYQKVKEMLEQKLDIDFSKLKKIQTIEFLDKQIDEVLTYFTLVLTENEKKILKYYMVRDFTGLEMIEPLMQDPNIEDISCDGVGIPIFVFHRDPNIGSIATNTVFDNGEQLDSFVIRLAQICGKSVSVSEPLLDGTLPDGSRVQATLGTDIARRGSNLTIRKFTEEPLTPVHLMNYGTLDSNILAFLWFVTDYGRSILVSGGTASGKTSLLNVLSLFIRPEKKIVSIEDTGELVLPHPHWVPVVARTAISAEGRGEVDMFELLRESLRQRPDYIVVGEVRGKEAYILFQQMATGHASLATIHAENIARLTDRLTTPPIALPAGLISSLDIVVFLARMRYKNKFIRKVVEVVEIEDFDQEANKPIANQIFKWNPRNDKFEITNKSISLKKVSDLTGIDEKDIQSEIERRIVVLEWMRENNITDYRDTHRIFSLYYTDPGRLLSAIQGAG